MTIILNCDTIKQLVETGDFKIIKKNQKIVGNCNYYFTPNMGINLYSAKVKFIDKKFIVFEFDKHTNSSLLLLLKNINKVFIDQLKINNSELFDSPIYNLFSEDESNFTLRCYLPNSNGKYFITVDSTETDTKLPFRLPRVNAIYDMAIVEIRNVWKKDETCAFNLELKYVKI